MFNLILVLEYCTILLFQLSRQFYGLYHVRNLVRGLYVTKQSKLQSQVNNSVLFCLLLAKKKEEEEDDDMKELEAWAENM